MQSVAQELAPHRIRVNSIAPGAIQTPINRAAWETPAALQSLLTLIPYGRIGVPEDIGQAAVWLASDAADYVHGQTIFVDGGMTLYPEFARGGLKGRCSTGAGRSAVRSPPPSGASGCHQRPRRLRLRHIARADATLSRPARGRPHASTRPHARRRQARGGRRRRGARGRWSQPLGRRHPGPAGLPRLERFRLDGTTPCGPTLRGGSAREARVEEPGANTTYVRYELLRAPSQWRWPCGCSSTIATITPRPGRRLCNGVGPVDGACVAGLDGAAPVRVLARGGEDRARPRLVSRLRAGPERERGLDADGRPPARGHLPCHAAGGDSLTVVLSTEPRPRPTGRGVAPSPGPRIRPARR